jgi:hypothetical protein
MKASLKQTKPPFGRLRDALKNEKESIGTRSAYRWNI